MRSSGLGLLAAAVALAAVACTDSTTGTRNASALTNAFLSLPAGYSALTSSFSSTGDAGGPFMPEHDGGMGGHHEDGAGLLGGDLMGGGMAPAFFGGIGFGRGFGHGPFGDADDLAHCAFSSATGRVTCTVTTQRGLTIVRSMAFKDGAGTAQAAPDSTTNSVNTHVEVSGTVTRRDSATSTIASVSDRTVTGLAVGSTQRTVNGWSRGNESTSGTSASGAFTATRVVGDTITGIIVPIDSGKPTYPTAGTVVRSMTATLTVHGQSPTTTTRREVITYDGSATAKIVITHDGTTKNCTMPLPRGKPVCS